MSMRRILDMESQLAAAEAAREEAEARHQMERGYAEALLGTVIERDAQLAQAQKDVRALREREAAWWQYWELRSAADRDEFAAEELMIEANGILQSILVAPTGDLREAVKELLAARDAAPFLPPGGPNGPEHMRLSKAWDRLRELAPPAPPGALPDEAEGSAVLLAEKAQEALKEAIERIRRNGYVFNRAPSDAVQRIGELSDGERWEHMAFALYTDLAEVSLYADWYMEAKQAAAEQAVRVMGGEEGEYEKFLRSTAARKAPAADDTDANQRSEDGN